MTTTATKTQWVARIYPRNPPKGYFARVYMLSNSGYPKFEEHRGWYNVDEDILDRLRRARNRSDDPDSKPVFQVCTIEQAQALDEAEELAAAKASRPIPMPRTRKRLIDLQGKGVVRPKKRATKAVEEEKPAFFETADPEDPEDHEFMGEGDWPDDFNTEGEEEAPAPKTKPTRAKKKTTRVAKKKTAKKATKKATKKAAKKTSKKRK